MRGTERRHGLCAGDKSLDGLDTVPLLTVLHTQFRSLFLSFPFPEVGQC